MDLRTHDRLRSVLQSVAARQECEVDVVEENGCSSTGGRLFGHNVEELYDSAHRLKDMTKASKQAKFLLSD